LIQVDQIWGNSTKLDRIRPTWTLYEKIYMLDILRKPPQVSVRPERAVPHARTLTGRRRRRAPLRRRALPVACFPYRRRVSLARSSPGGALSRRLVSLAARFPGGALSRWLASLAARPPDGRYPGGGTSSWFLLELLGMLLQAIKTIQFSFLVMGVGIADVTATVL
jgi:hypothetical protein